MKLNKKGFTLIELVLVVVLMAAIVLIALPNVFDMLNSGKEKKYVELEKVLVQNLKLYNIDNKEQLWQDYTSDRTDAYTITIPYDQVENGLNPLLSSNPDIALGDCTVATGGLKITRTGKQYSYSVCMLCLEKEDNYEYFGSGCEQ